MVADAAWRSRSWLGPLMRQRKSRLPIACACPAGAALDLETIGAVNRLVTARLERNTRLAVAAGTRGDEHFSSRRGRITATTRITGGAERIRTFRFARRPARRTSTWRIVEAATCVELLFTGGEHERRIAIAAREGLVCVLHADSRIWKWWAKALWVKRLVPATRKYTCPRQYPQSAQKRHL
jgi:hypothetical protein